MKKVLTNVKKKKLTRYSLPVILILLIIFVSAFILLAHRPAGYAPVRPADENHVSRYLTHELMPAVYNKAQLGESFEVVITQDGLNDIVSHLQQPIRLHNITLEGPQVIITPMQITLMATVKAKPVDFFLTIELNPFINQQGLLNLCVNRVLLGSIEITPIARLIGDKAYTSWMSSTGTEPNNIAAQVCRSLLRDEPFEPVFTVQDRPLRLSKIDVLTKKIVALATPEPSRPGRISRTSQTSSASPAALQR
jgi:uncharacterized protein YpmS